MANKKNNITFSDIAKYTNFSKTTISRYFNHPETLTEQNRNIIAEALEKLNYKENKVAKFWRTDVPNLSASSSQTYMFVIILRF